jgi:hypothetical protein
MPNGAASAPAGLWRHATGETDRVADAERWYDPRPVRPRGLAINPRCPECKTGPRFHPAHRWGPCWVRLPDGELCPHQEPTAEAR